MVSCNVLSCWTQLVSVFFFCRMLNFLGSIVIYTSKFRRVDCTLNWSYIHYGGLHCDSKYKQKIILVSNTRPLKFISAPREAKHFTGQLWQLMTASNVGVRTQAWQAKWAVFKILGFVCKRFLPFFPTPPRSFTCALFLAVSLTLVPRSFLLSHTETFAMQASGQCTFPLRQGNLTFV